jgi:pSer/pThr/pTyr-binding forkhead associated (FHA) protein
LTGEVLLFLRLLLALSLLVFLGWVIWVFWRELQTNTALIASRRIPPLSLWVLRPGQEPGEQAISQAECIIGRDPTSEIFLEDETISAHHARLTYHHNQWWLEDLRSTNGTKLNGELISTPTVVIPGDVVTLGEVVLRLAIPGQIVDAATPSRKAETGAIND